MSYISVISNSIKKKKQLLICRPHTKCSKCSILSTLLDVVSSIYKDWSHANILTGCLGVCVCVVQYTHNAYACQFCWLLKYPVFLFCVLFIIWSWHLLLATFFYCFPFIIDHLKNCPKKYPMPKTSYTSTFVYRCIYICICIQLQSGFDWQNFCSFSPTLLPYSSSSLYISDNIRRFLRSFSRLSGGFVFPIAVSSKGYPGICDIPMRWHFNKLSSSTSILGWFFPIYAIYTYSVCVCVCIQTYQMGTTRQFKLSNSIPVTLQGQVRQGSLRYGSVQ